MCGDPTFAPETIAPVVIYLRQQRVTSEGDDWVFSSG